MQPGIQIANDWAMQCVFFRSFLCMFDLALVHQQNLFFVSEIHKFYRIYRPYRVRQNRREPGRIGQSCTDWAATVQLCSWSVKCCQHCHISASHTAKQTSRELWDLAPFTGLYLAVWCGSLASSFVVMWLVFRAERLGFDSFLCLYFCL